MTRTFGTRRRPVRGPGRRRYEAVVDCLLDAIRDGTYRPGQRLPSEAALMTRHRVGRSTVREAMIALSAMGVVTLRNGAAARVAVPGPETLTAPLIALADVWRAAGGAAAVAGTRRLVEICLAREAAASAGPGEVAALEVALADNETSIGDPERFEETDLAFHAALARIVGNPVLSALLTAFSSARQAGEALPRGTGRETTGTMAPGSETGDREQAYREHVRVFHAIASGDPEGAASAMDAHLSRGERTLGAPDRVATRGRTIA